MRSALPVVAVLATAACRKATPPPEADPAKVESLAKLMIENTPSPAGAPACKPADLQGAPLTATTLIRLAHEDMPDKPERADWINPAELDLPAARVLIDPAADDQARRQAAAAFLGQRSFVVYRVEMVNVPLALEVKELKRGAVGMRAIGYGPTGQPTCIRVFSVQNDKQVSEWAMDKTNKAKVDPAIAKALREDLAKQLLIKVAALKQGR